MARICAICGQPIKVGEEDMPLKRRFVHKACFLAYEKGTEDKKISKQEEKEEKKEAKKRKKQTEIPEVEMPDAVSEEEYQEKKGYYDYLREVLDDEKIPSKIYAISNTMKDRYGFSFEGMTNTLKYLREIKEKELTGDIAGIIPYYYDEAQSFYKEVMRVENDSKGIDTKGMYEQKVIKIVPKKREIKQLSFD